MWGKIPGKPVLWERCWTPFPFSCFWNTSVFFSRFEMSWRCKCSHIKPSDKPQISPYGVSVFTDMPCHCSFHLFAMQLHLLDNRPHASRQQSLCCTGSSMLSNGIQHQCSLQSCELWDSPYSHVQWKMYYLPNCFSQRTNTIISKQHSDPPPKLWAGGFINTN